MPLGALCPWSTFHAWVTMFRKKWLSLSLYYNTYGCFFHQTYTNCSSWHDLLMPHGVLCPWPTFYASVTIARKKWLSLYYSTYGRYIHQTYSNCSSGHDLLIPRGGLCPWPTFLTWMTIVRKKSWLSLYNSTYGCHIHQTYTNCSSWTWSSDATWWFVSLTYIHALVTMVRKKSLSLYYSTYGCYIHQTYTNCSSWHDLLMPHGGLCPWPTFYASVTETQNGNSGPCDGSHHNNV